MSHARSWLEARRPAPPDPLLRAMIELLERCPGDGPVADLLARAALSGLADVAGGSSDRSAATPLLAVDALITYACQAAAEEGGASLGRILDRLDPSRFDAILDTVEMR